MSHGQHQTRTTRGITAGRATRSRGEQMIDDSRRRRERDAHKNGMWVPPPDEPKAQERRYCVNCGGPLRSTNPANTCALCVRPRKDTP